MSGYVWMCGHVGVGAQHACGVGVMLCIYKHVEVCGGPCMNVYTCTKCGR